MRLKLSKLAAIAVVIGGVSIQLPPAAALDFRVNIPKHTEATPVQKLNREGVKEVQKHHLQRAEKLFYRAYLIDPDDPFTLNNLGYISELQGNIERAQRYYQLAAKENNSETVIAESSAQNMKGRKLSDVTMAYGNLDLRVNRGNIQAMLLLQQGRNQEAEDVLEQTLKLDPRNPFTLNNLGFALEGQGDLEDALRYYNQASMTHSTEPVVVALDTHWRGKPISDIAFNNEQAVRRRLASEQSNEDRSARLSAEGVAALNHNEPDKALDYFRQAYKFDPHSAFALNNMGYVSEVFGDPETADEFYDAAARGDGSGTPVKSASRHEMVGEAAGQVAGSNAQGAEANLEAEAEARRRQHAPIVLRRRDNTPVTGPQAEEPATTPQTQPPSYQRPPIDNAPVESTQPPPQR